ncbi:hypothetical protein ACJX0J_040494, partial [Zea mays]
YAGFSWSVDILMTKIIMYSTNILNFNRVNNKILHSLKYEEKQENSSLAPAHTSEFNFLFELSKIITLLFCTAVELSKIIT